MEIQGKITAILAERTGVSARGEWKSQEFVITTQEQYPRKICFQVFGADKIASFALQVGQTVTSGSTSRLASTKEGITISSTHGRLTIWMLGSNNRHHLNNSLGKRVANNHLQMEVTNNHL